MFANRIKAFRNDEVGAITALALFLLVCFGMILGLAIDYANGVRNRAQMQAVVDSAALAAIVDLPDTDKATAAGLQYAQINLPPDEVSNAINAQSFEYGTWDKSAKTFSPTNTTPDAVRVTMTRTAATGNPVETFLLGLVGVNWFDITVNSIAHGDFSGGCETGGFFSDNDIISGSNNDYIEGFCLYGAQRVKIGSDNTFEDGVSVGMLNQNNLQKSGNNTGIDEALEEYEYTLVIPPIIRPLYDAFRDQNAPLPSFLQGAKYEFVKDLKDTEPNTIYIVSEVADLSGGVADNVAVIAAKEIKIDSNVTRGVFITPGKITVGSNYTFGPNDYCSSGEYSVYLFSEENIEIGSDIHFRGVQMGSLGEIKIGSTIDGVEAVHAEAVGNFDYGSGDIFGGCPQQIASPFVTPAFSGGSSSSFSELALVR